MTGSATGSWMGSSGAFGSSGTTSDRGSRTSFVAGAARGRERSGGSSCTGTLSGGCATRGSVSTTGSVTSRGISAGLGSTVAGTSVSTPALSGRVAHTNSPPEVNPASPIQKTRAPNPIFFSVASWLEDSLDPTSMLSDSTRSGGTGRGLGATRLSLTSLFR